MERLFLECTIRAALLVAGTAIVILALRVKDAAAKHKIWTGVMLLMLMLPAWTAWGPKPSVRLLPVLAQKTTTALAHDFLTGIPQPRKTDSEDFRATRSPVWNWQSAFLGVYLLGFSTLLLRLAIGTVRARKLVCRAVPFEGRLTSSSFAVPVTVGLLHPKVILPEQWREWPQAKLDAVLTHECEHARRRDPLIKWLAVFNRALYWFHPVAWWLESSLSALAEEACDNLVLSRGHRPRDYSEYLVQMARCVSESAVRLNIAGVHMPGSSLPKRIRRITQGSPTDSISRGRMALVVAACAVSCAVFAGSNLDHALAGAPKISPQYQPSGSPTSATNRPEFDSVTIRFDAGGDQPPGVGPTTANTSLGLLVASAYELPESQFFGLPDWADSDRFDIRATAGGHPGPDQTSLMWQSVLADRFKLTMHHETRQLPFYELVMAKPGRMGPQLHRNDTKCDPQAAMGTPPALACGDVSLRRTASALTYTGHSLTVQQFVAALAGFGSNEKLDRWGMNRNLDRPIQDRTGLKEKFDFKLEFAPLWPGFEVVSGRAAPPSLFMALEKQLGLKLEPRTGPVDVLVIDHVERPL